MSLIQYDVDIAQNFSAESLFALSNNAESILGYSPISMANRNFIRDNMGYKPLRKSILKVYGIDIKRLLKTYYNSKLDTLWPATNNVAMARSTLSDFVRWFTPVAIDMGNQKASGHAFERAIKIYSVLTGRKNIYNNKILQHFQMNSHQTQDFQRSDEEILNLTKGN